MMQVDNALLEQLAQQAALSPRRRQHCNLHHTYADPCQRLLNVLWHDSYIAPHRHALDPKDETLIALRGSLGCVRFDDHGTVTATTRLDTGDTVSAIIIAPAEWHMLMALTETAVLLEVKAGPFDPQAAKEPAPWAPAEGTAQAIPYLADLRRLFC